MQIMKVGLISSVLLTVVMNSKVEAFNFPRVTPDPDAPSYMFLPDGPITLLKRGETTNGRYTLAEVVLLPGFAVPPNIHNFDNEWIYIKEGNPRLFIGEKIYSDPNQIPGVNAPRDTIRAFDANPGTLLYGKKGRIRGGINLGSTPVKALLIWASAGFENVFKEISPQIDPLNPPPYNPDIPALFAATSPKYGFVGSSSLEGFGDIVLDNSSPYPDNNANELLSLLGEDSVRVPEYSSNWGFLGFGAVATMAILKRKSKRSLYFR